MNIGIVLPSLSASQLAFIAINQGNVISGLTDDEFIIFTNPSEACISPAFSCLNISEIIGFKGLLIATNLDDAELCLRLPTESQLIFYVWDLEFLRDKKDFMKNVKIYRNPKLDLYCRSNEHANVIENYCNRRPKILPNLNIIGLVQQITGKEYEFCRRVRETDTPVV